MLIIEVVFALMVISKENFHKKDPHLNKLLSELGSLINENGRRLEFPVFHELLNEVSKETMEKLQEIDNYCNTNYPDKKYRVSVLTLIKNFRKKFNPLTRAPVLIGEAGEKLGVIAKEDFFKKDDHLQKMTEDCENYLKNDRETMNPSGLLGYSHASEITNVLFQQIVIYCWEKYKILI